ncbi:type II methionyl aminopeptidase [Desulfurococcus mucosus]|uniref:Methionine aminopeptidase n=1 Tax=Desulfurococcus mucosus (strain ATCC 35584 / DSM 2162 / JCM 9187 / O7/1) TaxID=765177 RepID=E8R764_DESM0|nr:type II methionyl aminopeptidase [Desulfurococcus mucosus]ADV65529.1 methionine aminopeptidase, type II [Desulfurococcus mucosus DSM 2162]
MLSDDAVSKLKRAGWIARVVREEAAKLVKPGMSLLEVAERVEGRIRELGGEPAFPVNIGVNHVAAHYTPPPGDSSIIPDGSIVKIDLGVHVDGYIADTATTVSFNPAYEGLVEASQRALERVVEFVKPGVKASEIGRIIEETIKSRGFNPVRNLSGHSIDQYVIHSGLSIPNYNDFFAGWRLGPGVYAVEPFASTGVGLVSEGRSVTIYSLKRKKARLPPGVVEVYEKVFNERRTLPFAERWLLKYTGNPQMAVRFMAKAGVLHEYPVLVERSGGLVSQFEHTFIVTQSDVIVTTI